MSAMTKSSSTRNSDDLLRKLTNRNVVILGIGLILASLLLFWFAEAALKAPGTLHAITNSIAGALLTTGGLSLAWELVSRRAFAVELINRFRLSEDVTRSGLVGVRNDWQTVIDWNETIRSSQSIVVVVAYSERWYTHNEAALRNFLQRSGNTLRVYLADPASDEALRLLSDKYSDRSVDRIRGKIEETVEHLQSEANRYQGSIEIHYYTKPLDFAFYRFNDSILVTLYSQQGRSASVPAFVFNALGTIGNFYQAEFEVIQANSRPAPAGSTQ